METNTYLKLLPVPLSSREMLEMNDELLKLLNDADALEAEKKEAMNKFKLNEASIQKRIDEVRRSLASGQAMREVKVEEIPNAKKLVIEIHRLDVGKTNPARVVGTRAMDLFTANDPEVKAQRDEIEARADAKAAARAQKKNGKQPKLIKSKPAPASVDDAPTEESSLTAE